MTYYQRYFYFNQRFESGQLKEAQDILLKDKKGDRGKNRLIYYMNRGVVESMLGNYEEGNRQFEQAYITIDDYYKNPLNEGLAYLTNPKFVEYKGEDFEVIYIHYYKALNYLKMNQNEEALVECKRMNIKLSALSDKYTSEKKYKRDAFVHLLMGIIYEANHDPNNAFIAYRNALDIYQNDYAHLFGLDVPEQLKKDIIRTAYQTGFYDDAKRYKELFNMADIPNKEKTGEIIFLWHNGLCPIKTENSIEMIAVRGQGGWLTFRNEQMGLSFPFYVNDSDYESKGLNKLNIIRVAFPQYIERPAVFNNGSLTIDSQSSSIPLQLVEDVNAIAFKCLQERMAWEFGKALLRVAIKKAAEYAIRKENKDAATAVGILNAFTEQADTRHWQTLPHGIYYCRLSLPEGNHTITLTVKSNKIDQVQQHQFTFTIQSGKTYFHTFHSLESLPTPLSSYSY